MRLKKKKGKIIRITKKKKTTLEKIKAFYINKQLEYEKKGHNMELKTTIITYKLNRSFWIERQAQKQKTPIMDIEKAQIPETIESH